MKYSAYKLRASYLCK